MAIDEQGAPEPVEQQPDAPIYCFVIRPMRLVQTFPKLSGADGPTPEIAVLLCSRRHDSQTAARAPSLDLGARRR